MPIGTDTIRNIALLGHGSAGKTSLAESILFLTGTIDRLGKVTDGNTVGDSDAEEIKRKISISLATTFVDYQDVRVNLLDAPGYFDFAGEAIEALRVASGGVIVCGAKDGITVGLEKSWKYLADRKLPRAVFVSRIDEENGNYDAVYSALREKYGTSVCPMIAPIKTAAGKIEGVVDLIRRAAYTIENGKRKEIPIPDSMTEDLEALYTAVNESVAETDEELMEKYFSGEEFTLEERVRGLKSGVRDLTLFPVFCGNTVSGLGTLLLLDALVRLFPSPKELDTEFTEDGDAVPCDDTAPASALVYKSLSDQYGKFSLFKVVSGKITPDTLLTNTRTGTVEKLGHIYKMQGKKSVEVRELVAGDLGAASKLTDTKTGDTLCDAKKLVTLRGIDFPAPCYSMAIAPKTKGQEDKIAAGLTRLSDEDLTFNVVNNAETHQ
ncbi:MAG: GTP-binding protein, partial [Oscillospiraceae bacterium]|nr:GTP-binding protein [Oscillospiraceae bacterium]